MNRREFITLLGGLAATSAFVGRARAERVRRVGFLMGVDANDPIG